MSTFFIAAARIFYQRSLNTINPLFMTVVVNIVTFVVATAFYFGVGTVSEWPIEGIFWFSTVGIFGSLLGRYFSFVSQRLVGAARTSVFLQSVLIWSTIIGVFFLGESLDFVVASGILLVMFGGILLVRENVELQIKIKPVYYLAPIFTAFCFALTFLLRKYGLVWIDSPPLGMAVSNTTAIIFLSGLLIFQNDSKKKKISKAGVLNAIAGGLLNAFAAIFFWYAIHFGKVIEVVPIGRLSVLLVILFSWIFLREQESITTKVIIGGLVSVLGAFLIIS